MVPQTTAAMPDEMCFSASATVPLPSTNISTPTGDDSSHSFAVGHAAPRTLRNASSTSPTSMNRTLAIMNGGSASTATRIAR